eukprot:scaffold1497_cov21-Prasinocladus_malaysianus.AAC.1
MHQIRNPAISPVPTPRPAIDLLIFMRAVRGSLNQLKIGSYSLLTLMVYLLTCNLLPGLACISVDNLEMHYPDGQEIATICGRMQHNWLAARPRTYMAWAIPKTPSIPLPRLYDSVSFSTTIV